MIAPLDVLTLAQVLLLPRHHDLLTARAREFVLSNHIAVNTPGAEATDRQKYHRTTSTADALVSELYRVEALPNCQAG